MFASMDARRIEAGSQLGHSSGYLSGLVIIMRSIAVMRRLTLAPEFRAEKCFAGFSCSSALCSGSCVMGGIFWFQED
jgi:hypothetical protein